MNVLIYSYLAYLAILLGALVLSVYWRRKRRRTKLPFDPLIERVRRMPGEGARQKMDLLSDKIVDNTFAVLFAPWAVVVLFSIALSVLKPAGVILIAVTLTIPIFCFGILAFFVVRISRLVIERSDWNLGQFGERNVADNLEPLRYHGWSVFHDVPAENKGKRFNIDHVVVGPGGVFAVETKTPRRPELRNAKEEHIVEYDGEKLRWPNGRIDFDKPRRTASRAEWLLTWMIKQKLPVKNVVPLLAIPWWYVRNVGTGNGHVQAANPGQLIGIITSFDRVLSDGQITVIAAKLDQHCCDVEY